MLQNINAIWPVHVCNAVSSRQPRLSQQPSTSSSIRKHGGLRCPRLIPDHILQEAQVSNVLVGDMTSPWTKHNKSYILFGSTFQMPQSQSSRLRVLLFDIGGVCVCQHDTGVAKSLKLNCKPGHLPLPSYSRLRERQWHPPRLGKPLHLLHKPKRILAAARARRSTTRQGLVSEIQTRPHRREEMARILHQTPFQAAQGKGLRRR